MNDPRGELRRLLGGGAGEDVAESLRGSGAQAAVLLRTRRARRRRSALQVTGVAAVAAAAALGAFAWPGARAVLEPADPSPTSRPDTGDTIDLGALPDGPMRLDEGELRCGAADPFATDTYVTDLETGILGELTGTPVGDDGSSDPAAVGPGEEAESARWQMSLDDLSPEAVSISTMSVASRGGTIVGISDLKTYGIEGRSDIEPTLDPDGGEFWAPQAVPGSCGAVSYALQGGIYDVHVVVQIRTADGGVMQTVDPDGVPQVDFTGLSVPVAGPSEDADGGD